jgi:uncharacterized membrane protein
MSSGPGTVSRHRSDRKVPESVPRSGVADPAGRLATILCVAYGAITFGFFLVWKHFLAERSADEGIFENLLWNATHGYGLATWVESGQRLLPHLALHFSPVILLFVPLYHVFPSMHAVHLVLCASTAVAGWMVFRLARAHLDASTALMVMGAFLLHPTIVLQTFLEFHEQSLALLPLLVLVAAYRRGALVLGLVAALFLLGTREDNLFVVIAIGLLALVVRRDVRLGPSLIALGVVWVALYRWIAIGWLGGGQTAGVFASTYGIWGPSPGEAVKAMLADPVHVTRHLLSPTDLGYLAQLLAPFLGVVGFGDPLVLAMLPQLFMVLLAQHDTRLFQLRLHYSLVPVAMLTIGAIGTMTRLSRASITIAGRSLRWPPLLAGSMLAIASCLVPVWMTRAVQRLNPDADEARAVMAVVPDTASVTAPNYMLNHMARRRRIGFNWLGPLNEYVILEEPRRRYIEPSSMELVFSPEVARSLRAAGYVQVHARDGWHVWHRAPDR